MKKPLLLFVATIYHIILFSQGGPLDCGNLRYQNNVFPNVVKTTGITYGFNSVTNNGTGISTLQELKLDFYEPQGDPAVKRPLVILMFGGGFVTGQRSDLDAFCTELAKKGYAAATIDYRLVNGDPLNLLLVISSATLITDEVIKASSDLKAAIRFFKENAATTNTFKIDTTNIIVGGASAGSIAALHTAYIDDVNEYPALTTAYNNNGGFEGNTYFGTPGNFLSNHNSKGIVAVLNIAGGIVDTSVIDSNDPPIYSSQGTMDEVVPYAYGPISYNGYPTQVSLYGSSLIHLRAQNVGLRSQLLPVVGGNHESPGQPLVIAQIIQEASAFLATTVCGSSLPVTLNTFTVSSKDCAPLLRWKTASEQQSSHYEVEGSNDGVRFTTIGLVPSKNAAGGADYQYLVNGTSQPAWYRLKMQDKDGRFTYSPVQAFSSSCKPSIRLYPNPAKTFTTISGLQAGLQVRVLNANGSVLFNQKAMGNTLQIPLARFADGLLMVQVLDANGAVQTTQKFIKN